MPIEIRELVIKATVDAQGSQGEKKTGKPDERQKQQLVDECVAQVMDILRRQHER